MPITPGLQRDSNTALNKARQPPFINGFLQSLRVLGGIYSPGSIDVSIIPVFGGFLSIRQTRFPVLHFRANADDVNCCAASVQPGLATR